MLRAIFSNAGVQILGRLGTAVLAILSVKLVTGFLSQGEYGDYTVIFEYLAFFGIAADMGLFTIGVRELSRPGADKERVLGNIVGMRMALSVVALGIAVGLAFLLPSYGESVERGIAIAAGSMLAAFLAGSSATLLQVEMRMGWQALGQVLAKAVAVAVLFWATRTGQPFLFLVAAGLAGNLAHAALIVGVVSRRVRLRLLCDLPFWKRILKTALPYGVALILGTIYFRLDSVMLYHLAGREETAVYGIAARFLEILNVAPLFFLNSAIPALTALLAAGKEKAADFRRLAQTLFDSLGIAGASLAAGTIAVAPAAILLIAQPSYLPGALPLRILMGALFLFFLNSLFAYLLVLAEKPFRLLAINSACVALNFALNLFAIPRWGAVGAAATSVVSELFVLVAAAASILPLLKLKLSILPLLKGLLAGAAMAAILLWLEPARGRDLLWAVPAGAGIFFLGLAALGISPWKLLRRG